MGRLAAFVVKYHRIILPVALVLIIVSIIASRNIVPKTEIKDLLPDSNPQVQSYNEINEQFAGGTTLFITIEGQDRERMTACAESFAGKLKANEKVMGLIRAINLKIERDFITRWGFLFQEAEDIKKNRDILGDLNLLPFLTNLNDSFEETYMGDEKEELETRKQENEAVAMLKKIESFVLLLRSYLEHPGKNTPGTSGRELAECFIYGDSYMFNWDNTCMMFSLTPDFTSWELEKITALMGEIKRIRRAVQKEYPELHIGYSGDVAIQADKNDALAFDMMVPTLAAIVLIFILFMFSFKPLRTIVFAVVSLITGIIFTYGIVGATLKEVNIFTSIMAVLLVGLGIDYGIQVITNYTMFREDGNKPGEALHLTFVKAGMGTFLAAMTTATGFFVLAVTGSRAYVQFGLVMGIGIIICFVSMIFILPSLLILMPGKNHSHSRFPNVPYTFLVSVAGFARKHRWISLIATFTITGIMLYAMTLNTIQYDMMKLNPQDMPSMVAYKMIMEKYGLNPFSSMVIADSIEEAQEFTHALEKEKSVVRVNSIATYLPPGEEQEERLKEIAEIRAMPVRYRKFQYTPGAIKQLLDEIQRLEWNIIEIGDLSVAGLGEDNNIVKKRNAMIREVLGAETGKPGKEVFRELIARIQENPGHSAEKLTLLDIHFAGAMDAILCEMSAVDRKITVHDLPESVTKSLFDRDMKRNLIVIYPQENVMNSIETMEWYNSRVEKISPRITGVTQIAVTWQKEIVDASLKAVFFIFLVVLLFIIINFRSAVYSLFAVVPLLFGMVWMLGIYPLLNFKINLFNMAVIPLVIGMGIDFGIHLVHRYRMEGDIETTYRSTGKAVFLSALTTMIGFGSLAFIGKFGSLASIGVILFLGIATCLVSAMFVLPALLGFGKKRENTYYYF